MASKPTVYDQVMSAEDHEELLSSTDVDESVTDEEKGWQSGKVHMETIPNRSKLATTFKTYRWLVDTILLLFNICLSILLLLRSDWYDNAPSSLRQVGGDFAGDGPHFSLKVQKWNADVAFVPANASDFFSDETLARWNTVMPAGTRAASSEEVFSTTSMTHQLHCLFMMGRIYSGVTSNITHGLPDGYHTHFLHCIDYLRQAVMCSADLALEPHAPTDGADLGPLDGGWNGIHVCKDYDQVVDFLEHQIRDGVRVVLPIDD